MQGENKHEGPDLRGPAIVVTGGVIGGFDFHGPFETVEAASQWWQTTLGGKLGTGCSIALLEKPETLSA